MTNETLEQQTNGPHEDFEKFDNNLSQNQVTESNIDDRIRSTVDNAVSVFENRMQDAFLTAMNDVVIPRVEIAVRLITDSSRNRPNSLVQNPD